MSMVVQFYKKILKSLFLFAFSPLLSAQNPDLEAANVHFQSALFKEAIPEYERVLLKDPNHALSKARLAACYRFTNNLSKAAFYYAQIANHPEYKKQLLEYGQTLKSLQQYDEAQKIFTQYAQAVDASVGNALAKSCEWAKTQNAAQNALFSVQNLDSLNTKNADFAPAFFKDQLVFSSARSVAVDKKGTITWTNDAFNQSYLAIPDASGQKFVQAKPLRNFIGKDINDAPLAFSKDGNYVAITSNNFMDGIRQIDGSGLMMDIYNYEVLSMREWKQSSEQFFPYNASVDSETPFSTGHPFLSEKGEAMYFCSNRPGGFGGYDIYVAYRTQRGWTIPKNMGAPINTPGNEMSPFLDASGRLFFASDFHPGFGGLDIFTAERFNTAWVNVQNLGAGINSPFDDFYFIYDNQRRQAYFTSNRAGGKGNEDIYKGTQLKNFNPRAKQSIDLGEQLVFRYIQFNERNELVFSNGEGEMMQELLMALLDNPDLVIQVYAFTDARGTPANNLENSSKRARLLSEYLTANGIPAKRIQHAGFGENYLLNNCRDRVRCTESEHFVNRRIEITIAGKMDVNGIVTLSYDATPNPKMLSRTVPAENRTKPREVTITMSELPTVTAPSVAEKGVPDPRNVEKTKRETSSSRKSRDEREKIREQDLANSKNKKNVEPEPVATNPKNKKLRRKDSYSVGDEIETADIFHEKNKTSVDEKNSPGLKEILELMIDQPYLVLEIGSHTDSKGDDKLNQDLSQKRADAIRSYLVKKGIPNDRLVAKGYGETKILNKCKEGVKCSDDEHEANRRTEFKVVGQKGFKVNDVIQVAAIEYGRNDAKIDMKRSKGLQEILEVLKGSSISVEIRSHTDANGTSKYNLELSEKRAKSIYDYLVKNGISKFRLKYKGYGETILTNHCKEGVKCSDEEHAQNRRTDFKILGLK